MTFNCECNELAICKSAPYFLHEMHKNFLLYCLATIEIECVFSTHQWCPCRIVHNIFNCSSSQLNENAKEFILYESLTDFTPLTIRRICVVQAVHGHRCLSPFENKTCCNLRLSFVLLNYFANNTFNDTYVFCMLSCFCQEKMVHGV